MRSSRPVNPFSAFTLSGPLVGLAGWALAWDWMFWIGVALAAANLFLNLASGVMRFPILPLAAMVAGAWFSDRWFSGVALGLLLYTALEGVGTLPIFARGNSNPPSPQA